MSRRTAVLWPLLFLTFMLIIVVITTDFASPGAFILLGCILGLMLWYSINTFVFNKHGRGDSQNQERREAQSTRNRDIGSDATQSSLQATRTNAVIGRVQRAQREPYNWQNAQLFAFASKAHIARLAMRALPPVISFTREETITGSQHECPICMEDFKNGELIQPFQACAHEFHSSCLNSWLLGGKTSCPVCRMELSITFR